MTSGAPVPISHSATLIVWAILSLSGCAVRQVPQSNATAAGVRSRTGLELPDRKITSDEPLLPPGLTLTAPLSSDSTAALALWNNRRLHADLGALGLAAADLMDAGLV